MFSMRIMRGWDSFDSYSPYVTAVDRCHVCKRSATPRSFKLIAMLAPGGEWTVVGGFVDALILTLLPTLVQDLAIYKTMVEGVGLVSFAGMMASDLPMEAQKLLDIARALMAKPRVLPLDEPAAGLNDTETAKLAAACSRSAAL
jgi:hypothetical protein